MVQGSDNANAHALLSWVAREHSRSLEISRHLFLLMSCFHKGCQLAAMLQCLLAMNAVQTTTELLASAEQELQAFAGAVTGLFGEEQAQQSAQDWLQELELMDWPTGDEVPNWRRVTIAAAARLAGRLKTQI